MTVQQITPASGALTLTIPWGDGTAIYTAGDLVSVPPGSALETAIGLANMTPLSGQQLATAANGGAGGGVELMALSRYVLSATVTVPAGTPATPAAGEPATGGAAGYGNASISAGAGYFPQTFLAGTAIILDPAGQVYAAIGAGNLRAYVQGQDDRGGAALSN